MVTGQNLNVILKNGHFNNVIKAMKRWEDEKKM